MAFEGAHPLDPTSDVGKVRLLTGDVTGKPITPEGGGTPTTATYEYWSDAEFAAFLELGMGNAHLAAAQAYTQLAATISMSQQSTRTFRTEDLNLGGTTPGGDIRLIAREWRYLAEQTRQVEAEDYGEVFAGPSLFG